MLLLFSEIGQLLSSAMHGNYAENNFLEVLSQLCSHCSEYLQTNSISPSPSWEIASGSATQKFSNILWNLKVNECVHKSLPTTSILSWVI
jgi:hypothetical protein